MDHEYFMRRAIELALKVPQFAFGAIIVKRDTGEIIAEGFNQSTLNPTFHGEMVAINHCAELQQHPDEIFLKVPALVAEIRAAMDAVG